MEAGAGEKGGSEVVVKDVPIDVEGFIRGWQGDRFGEDARNDDVTGGYSEARVAPEGVQAEEAIGRVKVDVGVGEGEIEPPKVEAVEGTRGVGVDRMDEVSADEKERVGSAGGPAGWGWVGIIGDTREVETGGGERVSAGDKEHVGCPGDEISRSGLEIAKHRTRPSHWNPQAVLLKSCRPGRFIQAGGLSHCTMELWVY